MSLRVCPEPGCPTFTKGGRCPDHRRPTESGRAMPTDWKRTRARIVKRDHGICHYCGRDNSTSCDHLIPVSKGGTDNDDNLVCSCWPCNQKKGDRVTA